MGKKLTIEEFIKRAKEVHGDKYDYSKVEYINTHTKINIICPKHGEFPQTPTKHLSDSCGCPKCGGNVKLTTEEFIVKARKVHGDKYDYSKVEYLKNNVKIIIICPNHGKFQQTPVSHSGGVGCPICSKRKTTKEFIMEARKIHNNKYDYSKVEYFTAKHEIIIICLNHGEFLQTPSNHLRGQNCPKCSGKGFEYKPLNKVKEIIRQYNIKTKQEYLNWWDKNEIFCRENGIPKHPNSYYNNH